MLNIQVPHKIKTTNLLLFFRSNKYIKLFEIGLILGVISLGLFLRFLLIDARGADQKTYLSTVQQFHAGKNFYYETVASFKDSKTSDVNDHGYSYFPTMMYFQYVLWLISNSLNIPVEILWKIPTILSEFGIIVILYIYSKKLNPILKATVIGFWYLSPYFMARFAFVYYEPVFLFFALLSLIIVRKNIFGGSISYFLAISLKTIPIILFPLMLSIIYEKHFKKDYSNIKEKILNKNFVKDVLVFISGGFLVFLIISIPFLKSIDDFVTYINGAFFVHSERGLQGRPLITFINYLTYNLHHINFMQAEYSKYYAMFSIILATLIPTFFYLKGKITNTFTWAFSAFGIYIFFTPVFNRSHILWIIPWLLMWAIHWRFKKLGQLKSFMILVALYLSFYIYSNFWNDGFSKTFDYTLDDLFDSKSNIEKMVAKVKNEYYELRSFFIK